MPPSVASPTDVVTTPGRAPERRRTPRLAPFVPKLAMVGEPLLVDVGEGIVPEYREVQMAVLQLSFVYRGVTIAAADAREHVVLPGPGSSGRIPRDFVAEARARQLLESYGPVELEGLASHAALPDSRADYIVDLEGDIDALCTFSTFAIPKLRALGWEIEAADDYPCRVVTAARWYADVASDDAADWFELELGIEVEGQRVDLLPALVELLGSAHSASGLDARLRRARRPVAVPLGGHTYLAIAPERLRAIVEVLSELYAIDGAGFNGTLRVPKLLPFFMGELGEALGEGAVEWRGDCAWQQQSRDLLALQSAPVVAVPPTLRATLRPYQRSGLDWLQNLRAHGVGGVLADDMGLGKTLQTIAHLAAEKAAGRLTRPAMVVAPTSLVCNWQRELAKFAPGLGVVAYHGAGRARGREHLWTADVIVTSYPILTRDLPHLEAIRSSIVGLDEAPTVKNVRSQAHRAVKALEAEHRLCLSGTPIENNLEELWALFDFVMPGWLGTVEQFRTTFRGPIEKLGNAERLAMLRRRVAPFILRRMKESVAHDLPPKTEIMRPVELSGDQRELYEAIRIAAHAEVRSVVRKKGLAASTIDILGALMKLRQVCCDPRLVPVTAARAVQESAKLEALLEMLDEQLARKRRILVFSQFTSMLALIAEALRARGVRFVTLTGATANRQAQVDAFQSGEAEVFLISLKAGGTGLNLTRADTVIHYDPWWNPQAQAQATDRAYRIGQTRPVFVYNLIVSGSVEERMLGLQQRKRELADGLLAGGETTPLSQRDIDSLFAPLQ